MNILKHCCIGLVIRLLFIVYSYIQDEISEVKYTDIDYKVFTDAARHLINANSPYKRHTYRYPPIIAFLMIPNLLIHPAFGKLIFSLGDILVFLLICKILKLDGLNDHKCYKFALFWLYNPLSVVISTRGNADSIAALVVIATLYWHKKSNYLISGLFHGLAVHIRLYPVVFSIPLYLSIETDYKNKLLKIFGPTKERIFLIFSSLLSFSVLTGFNYLFFGNEFLEQSLLYHLKRFDIRHNYSVYFYLNYLEFTSGSIISKLGTLLPMVLLLLIIPFYYRSKNDIAFSQMCMAFILVMFNSVVTCQYFIWYLSLLPLCLPKFSCSYKELFLVSNFWFLSQAAWLLPAYLLEFKSQDTFIYIWFQCLVFFWANVTVLSSLIRNYDKKLKII